MSSPSTHPPLKRYNHYKFADPKHLWLVTCVILFVWGFTFWCLDWSQSHATLCMYTSTFSTSKKVSVEDWVFPVQFWPWTPPFSVFLPRYYRSACDCVRDQSNIKACKVQRNNARDADPPKKVRCNAGTQARQLRCTYLATSPLWGVGNRPTSTSFWYKCLKYRPRNWTFPITKYIFHPFDKNHNFASGNISRNLK